MTRALVLAATLAACLAASAPVAHAGVDLCVWLRPDRPPVACVPYGG